MYPEDSWWQVPTPSLFCHTPLSVRAGTFRLLSVLEQEEFPFLGWYLIVTSESAYQSPCQPLETS
jgi:hypothetical protein